MSQITTKKEIACMFGISVKTLSNRLKEIDITGRKRLLPKELDLIFNEFGHPGEN